MLINTGILNLASFASILSYICMCGCGSVFRKRIRIQEAPEYGSGSTTQEKDQQMSTLICCYIPTVVPARAADPVWF